MRVDPVKNAVIVGLLAIALLVAIAMHAMEIAGRPKAVAYGAPCDVPEGAVSPSLRDLFCRGKLPVNRATAGELEILEGIGPARAGAIVRHREAHGPFGSPGDLDAVPGIGPATVRRLAPWLGFD